MKTYIYTVIEGSPKRGYNGTVKVWRIKNNQPHFVGKDEKIQFASTKGGYAVACNIISEVDGHKLTDGGYRLESKNIQLFEV